MERKNNTGKITRSTQNRKAAPKKSPAKKNTLTPEQMEQIKQKNQVKAVVMFILAVLMLFIVVIPGENVWMWMHSLFLGFFGFWAILWPILLGYIASIIALKKPLERIKPRIWLIIGTIVLVCATMYVYSDLTYVKDTNMFEFLGAMFTTGVLGSSSGVIGGIIGSPLILSLGVIGARIVVTLLLVLALMILTGTTLARVLNLAGKPVNVVKENINHVREKRQRDKEEARQYAEVTYSTDNYSEEAYDKVAKRKEIKKEKKQNLQDFNEALGIKDKEKEEEYMPVPKKSSDEFLSDFPSMKPRVKEEEASEDLNTAYEKINVKEEIRQPEITQNKNEFFSSPKTAEATVKSSTTIPLDASQEALDNVSKMAQEFIKKREETEKEQLANSAQMALYDENKDKANTYVFPPISMIEAGKKLNIEVEREELQSNGKKLVDTLKSFGVQTKIIDICRGPSVTRYELQPAAGVKISKITNLADDLALNLAATGVRIEAPIPGKPAVGIEIPNKNKSVVRMRELLESNAFIGSKSKLTVVLGRDIAGQVTVADLAKMPHTLIAGTTGSGKSVCINSLVMSLIFKSTPDEVRFLMIDPKVVELGIYNGIPHLLVPVVTDPRKAAGALNWAVTEMLNRYKIFADFSVKDLHGYNELAKQNGYVDENGQPMLKMPQIVIIIDELADLMMAAPNEVEDSICRLAQMARAAGMHLVVATQRPTVDVVTGLIKANIPSRIAFAVSSAIDSRTILDSVGAEKLLGQGDMLFSPVGMHKPTRIQGCFVTEKEIEMVVDFVKNSREISYDEKIIEDIEKNAILENSKGEKSDSDGSNADPMLEEAIKCVMEAGQASTSLLQRRLRLGYARAGRLVDEMEQMGIVGPHEGSKPRQVLMSYSQWLERNMQKTESADDETSAPV